jgi:hypothetical protein
MQTSTYRAAPPGSIPAERPRAGRKVSAFWRFSDLRKLLPAETRAAELVSAGSLFLCGAIFAFFPLADTMATGIHSASREPAWFVSSLLLNFSIMHIGSIIAGPTARLLRLACIFTECMVWSYISANAANFGVYPPGLASAAVYAVLAFSMAWSFLARAMIWEAGNVLTIHDVRRL